MGNVFSIIGYFVLGFVVLSNYIDIELSNTGVILLAIVSAIFMIAGIFIEDKRN